MGNMDESKRATNYSEAPTMVPSRTSLEKETAAPGNDGAPSDSASASAAQQQPASEKPESLARAPTATSQAGGQSLAARATREDGAEYPSGAKLAAITVALCLSVFLMALDNSIIATAIPKITDEFRSVPDIGWYGSGKLPRPLIFPSADLSWLAGHRQWDPRALQTT